MKMKLYYVVEDLGYEAIDYVAGPFTFDGARAYKEKLLNPCAYSIVDQTVEVDY